MRTTLLVLFAAVALLMLLACVNLANLILSRASTRAREFAIRAALGSGRARLQQMLTEALLLGTVAAPTGVLLAEAALRWFRAANPIEWRERADITARRGYRGS